MNPRLRVSLLSLALLATLGATALADNWPRFRGPDGAGISDDKEIPVKWTKDNILWKTALPGVGHSSPVIWGDRVFLQSATSDGKERRMLCVDAVGGKVLWSKSIPGGKGKTHARSSLASGTPATDGERVYAIFWDGNELSMHAFDFKGTEVWSRELGPFTSQHGAGHSPIVWRDEVIFADDQDGSAVLMAFDSKTGADKWRATRKAFRACYSTPLIRENGGRVELLVGSTAGVTSYNPLDGKENWNFNWKFPVKPLRTVSSPVLAGNLILVTSGDGDGSRHAIAVKLDGKGDVSGTNLVWENKKVLPYVPCPLAYGDHFYTVNDAGFAACYEAQTGKEIWNKRLESPVTASPILIDGKIYTVGEDGKVFVFEAKPTFKLLATNEIHEDVSATPAVADHRLFIRGKEHLYCIGVKK